jgi:hypothetical protein
MRIGKKYSSTKGRVDGASLEGGLREGDKL